MSHDKNRCDHLGNLHRIIDVFDNAFDQVLPASHLADVIKGREDLEALQQAEIKRRGNRSISMSNGTNDNDELDALGILAQSAEHLQITVR